MRRPLSYGALLLSIVAVGAWIAVGLYGWSITRSEQEYVAQLRQLQESVVSHSSVARTHAVVSGTSAQRDQLDRFLNVDIISLTSIIQDVGKAAGVSLKLNGVMPDTAPSAAAGTSLNAVGLSLQADGTFSALMRTLQLLEQLPLPASVERVDLQGGERGNGGAWHMNTYLKVFTTATISS